MICPAIVNSAIAKQKYMIEFLNQNKSNYQCSLPQSESMNQWNETMICGFFTHS